VDPLVALEEAIDTLVGSDTFSYSDPESIVALERQLARLGYVVSSAVAAFEAAHEFAPDGAKTAGAWLATRCHLPVAEARGQLRRGRALDVLPLCAEAWSDGAIAASHVDALAQVRTPSTQEALARDEALLVHHAQELRFAPFVRALAYWEQHADPDGADESDMGRRARRDVYLSQSVNGMYLGQMTLDPISGAIVAGELERLERRIFEDDWAEAKAHLGREPRLDELGRSAAQRRADALVEMATRSKSTPADARRPEPLFSILVGYEELYGRICRIEGGPVVSPGSLLAWLEGASFERVVFAPGQRVECSPTARFFTGATRRAIELRDQECTHHFCDVPAKDCEIDHIVPFGPKGPTTQENGRVHCGFHNRLRNGRPPPQDPEE
jgi:hypothetical protein